MSVGRGWRYPIPPGRWEERLAEYESAVADGIALQHMADIVRSIIDSGHSEELCSTTSHFDLIVAATPADEPPLEVIAVRTLAALKPTRDGYVRIEHQSLTGHDDSIERPITEAVQLFWRFVILKFGIEPEPRVMGPGVLTRQSVTSLLEPEPGWTQQACLRALRNGADIRSGDERSTVPVESLLHIFRRRLAHVRRIGLATPGLEEGVRSLESTSEQRLHLGIIEGEQWWFQVLVSEDRERLVACWAIERLDDNRTS